MGDILGLAGFKKAELSLEVKSCNHPQFFLDTEAEHVSLDVVESQFGGVRDTFAGQTTYPCKYNYPKIYQLD